jgi:23S rRNA (cytosine1962-C5)-methyltransferase
MYQKIIIQNAKTNPIKTGHPWVFSGALVKANKNLKSGSIVYLYNENNQYLATGFYNNTNSIAFRAISFNEADIINEDFIYNKLHNLKEIKENLLPQNTNSYRLTNSEGDYLPGVIIDIYDKLAVFQISVFGAEALRDFIINALKKLNFTTVVEKSDSNSRLKEGLQIKEPLVHFSTQEVSESKDYQFIENSMQLLVNPIEGQKTGFFLDQRLARSFVKSIAKNKSVINLFSYTGAFSISALLGGAAGVLSVDVSAKALEMLNKTLDLFYSDIKNKSKTLQIDVFDFLNKNFSKDVWDSSINGNILICDPPAFAKNSGSLKNATNAYIKLNAVCLEKLKTGDIFITSSCSGLLKMDDFIDIIKKSALLSGKKLSVLKEYKEDIDHTSILGFKEGNYLKTLILRVL